MNLFDSFNEVQRAIVEFENNLRPMEVDQRISLKKIYDDRGIPFSLHYGFVPEENMILFATTSDGFKAMEYYLGFEYAREDLQLKIEIVLIDTVIVGYYAGSDRVRDFLNELQDSEVIDSEQK